MVSITVSPEDLGEYVGHYELMQTIFTGGPIFILQLLKESKMHQSKENLTDLFKKIIL